MISWLKRGLALAALAVSAAGPVQAAQLCGWLIETVEADDLHQFDLWLEADGQVDIFYKMTGEGIYSESSQSYSPGSGTYSLRTRTAAKVWGFGTTLNTPADIDIVAEIHAPPKSVFSDEETPLLAAFTFRRHVPEDEGAPPKAFGARQCVTVTAVR
jgi:hypothetical protein